MSALAIGLGAVAGFVVVEVAFHLKEWLFYWRMDRDDARNKKLWDIWKKRNGLD